MNLPVVLLAAGALLVLVATPVLGVFTWRVWSRERHVPRVQVPARVIHKHTPGLSGMFQASFSPRYHYELEVEYPVPAGEQLTGKVKVDNAPTIARPEPFDGTV
ncbi:hypothetical protein [Microbacterium lacticum]